MKKGQNRLLSKKVLIAVIAVIVIAACAVTTVCIFTAKKDNTPSAPTEPGTQPTAEPVTQAPTQAPTEPPTEAPTEAPTEPEPELTFNLDLLNEVGLTFAQLRESRGKVVSFDGLHGGTGYKYENGYGWYLFSEFTYDGGNHTEGNSVFDEEGNYFAPKPQDGDESICLGVERVNAMYAFINAADTVSLEDIKRIDGVEDFRTGADDLYGGYYTSVVYDGLYICFGHADGERINLNSEDQVQVKQIWPEYQKYLESNYVKEK